VPPLDKIRAAVTARAVEQKARELAKTKADETLAQLAKGPGAGLKETPSFSYGEKGDIPGIGTSPDLMEAAFALTTAAPVAKQAYKVGESWYAIRLASRSETDMATFNSSKEQLKQTLLPKKKGEAVSAWLKELRAKAKIEKDATIFAE
jgi:peptidyl-prolyl cis-trans isomerase D